MSLHIFFQTSWTQFLFVNASCDGFICCTLNTQTCPEEASRLMVVRSIQPRLASSLWFTSRNCTMALLAASVGGAHTQTESLTRLTVCACGSNPFSHVSLCVTGLIWGRTLSQLEVMTSIEMQYRGTSVNSQRIRFTQKNIIFCSTENVII